MARDIDSLLRQQAALATFGTFAFQEPNLAKILDEAARICADSLGVRHCKVCRYRPAENDLRSWPALDGTLMSWAKSSRGPMEVPHKAGHS